MLSILFIVPHRPNRSPSQRFRIEHFIPIFEEKGYKCDYSYLLNEKDDKIFYSKGKVFQKVFLNLKFIVKRLRDFFIVSKYDIVFVQREAIFLGTSLFEYLYSKRAKLIFDFDDAIWLPNVSLHNRKFLWLKNPSKIKKSLRYADYVIVGNSFLADFAYQYNNNVAIIPTTIDTNKYDYKLKKSNEKYVCIGWTGSLTTIEHLKKNLPVLEKLKKKYGDTLKIKVISNKSLDIGFVDFVEFVKWRFDRELEDLIEIDVGIMPLPNNDWSKGKCGLKALQYMSLGIPTVVSPVGVNTEIIKDGVNGFLAETEKEWFDKLSLLIENKELRQQLGKEARKTVERYYSVEANKEKYFEVFKKVLK